MTIARAVLAPLLVLAMPALLALLVAPTLGQDAEPQGPFFARLESIRHQHGVPALTAYGTRWDGDAARSVGPWADGTRVVNREMPVEPGDLWHIGSCTKALTATLLATYVAEGKLAWDDTLAEALPELADLMSPPLAARTVADLLRHQAGLAANASPRLFAQIRTMDTAKARAEVVREALLTANAVHEGDPPAYSNTGYVVAGAICERLGGKPWEELLAQRVLLPLGITKDQFGFGPPAAGKDITQPLQPVGHARVGSRWMPMPPTPLADNPAAYGPAGTLHLSLDAWGRFAMAHARGGDLAPAEGDSTPPERDALGLSKADYAELHRERLGFAAGWMVARRPWAAGRGEHDGGVVLTHAGSNTYWFATVWIAPEKDWVLLSATNAAGEAGPKATDAAVGVALAALVEAAK